MIETVVAYQLAVGETLRIQKKRLMPGAGNPNIGRISIVSGIHGDELEGQYVCYEIIRADTGASGELKWDCGCLSGIESAWRGFGQSCDP